MDEKKASLSEASAMLICLDEFDTCDWTGRLYIRSQTEPVSFWSLLELLERMETLYDQLNFPQVSTSGRTFQAASPRKKSAKEDEGAAASRQRKKPAVEQPVVWSEQEMRKERGRRATFLVRVQYRQRSTWQGQIHWAEKNRTMSFRSTLELLKLLDAAGDAKEAGWSEEE